MVFRKGSVGQDGDCHIWSSEVCTCGLLHILVASSSDDQDFYQRFAEEWGRHERKLEICTQIKLQTFDPVPEQVNNLLADVFD